MGFAELSGGASVTYVSAGDYVALRVLNVGGFDEVVTIKEDVRLFCLQADADAPSVAAALIGGCALLAFARGPGARRCWVIFDVGASRLARGASLTTTAP